jgi:Na+/H+ antiporter NhaC
MNLNNTNSIHHRKNINSSSNKSIYSKNIKIIFNPFINKPLNYNKNNLNKYSSIKYKNLFKIIFISIISLGIIIGIIYIFSNENIKNEIHIKINKICNFSYFFYILILFGFLFIILYYFIKLNENKYFIKSAKEDYEIIINNLKEKKLDENYIGIFQNQFIKEISENRNISHEKYLKLIFPKLLKLIKEKNEIYESEIYISDQCQKIWNLNE